MKRENSYESGENSSETSLNSSESVEIKLKRDILGESCNFWQIRKFFRLKTQENREILDELGKNLTKYANAVQQPINR